MADVTDLFKKQKINKIKVGPIVAHVNNLLNNDEEYEELFQADPIGCLMQFGLSRKISTYMIAELKLNHVLTLTAKQGCDTEKATRVKECLVFATVEKIDTLKRPCIIIPQIKETRIPKLCNPQYCYFTNEPPITTYKDKITTVINPVNPDRFRFLENFPKIDDTKAWNDIASGKRVN